MVEPHVHLVYAPRGPGVMCAAFWSDSGTDLYGWFTGARADEHPAHFFLLENYYSVAPTVCYCSREDDVRGTWVKAARGDGALVTELDRPVLAENLCHEVERLQDAFVREWLFYRDDAGTDADAAALRARELPVMALNIRATKLARLQTSAAVWTYTSPGADLNVITFLARHWTLDYAPQ